MENRQFNEHGFEQYLGEDKFMGAKCASCGTILAPPRAMCNQCRGSEMEWIELSGRGKLKTFTIITVAPPSMTALGYGRNNPYCTGVVELEEKCGVVARIEGLDFQNPESISLDMDMKVNFLHWGEGEEARSVLAFEPA
jgi:hypothetical protein